MDKMATMSTVLNRNLGLTMLIPHVKPGHLVIPDCNAKTNRMHLTVKRTLIYIIQDITYNTCYSISNQIDIIVSKSLL